MTTTPLGKYKLVKLVASGGMAEVYLARKGGAAGFEKLICLKRILPHLAKDKAFVEMFLNEARLAARLDHPNIVSIFDLGEVNGNYFIAMEFIDGPSLRAIAKTAVDRGELLPVPEVVKCISMAAAGLEYAHNLTDSDGRPLGLVHRDISPDNILVHKNGAAKVVDFGIAKAANSSSGTRTGTLKGKIAYMPPEQLRGEPLDRRADVFALGVCLYELIAGKRPWEGTSEVALIGKIMTEEPAPLAPLRPNLPPALIAIVEKCLSKDREGRYQSCEELHAALDGVVAELRQNVSTARISDFVKAYSPEPSPPTEFTDPKVEQLEAELSGTSLTPQNDGTVVLDQPVRAKRGRPVLVGFVTFLLVIVGGGAGGYVALQRLGRLGPLDWRQGPIVVEHASVVVPEPPKPPPAEAAKPSTEIPPAIADPAKVASADAGSTIAVVEPPKAVADAGLATPPEPAAIPVATPVETHAEASPAATKPPPKAPRAKGRLVLFVRPWARVEIDGHDVGVTPLDPIQLTAGDHEVRLVNSDLGKDVIRTVHITTAEEEVLKEILDE